METISAGHFVNPLSVTKLKVYETVDGSEIIAGSSRGPNGTWVAIYDWNKEDNTLCRICNLTSSENKTPIELADSLYYGNTGL